MKSVVIKTGGKQYLVSSGDHIKIEKIKGLKEKDSFTFDNVLLSIDGDNVLIGNPNIKDAKVSAEVVTLGRSKKIIVTKYKQKSRYMKRNGHRQEFALVKILKV